MKSRTKPALRVVPAVPVQLSLSVQGVLADVQHAFYGLCVAAGKQVLAAMMEADRRALCGAANVPDARRLAVRGGTTRSAVVLGRPAHRNQATPRAQSRAWRTGATHLRVGRQGRPAGRRNDGLDGRGCLHAALCRHARRTAGAGVAALGVQERCIAALGGADTSAARRVAVVLLEGARPAGGDGRADSSSPKGPNRPTQGRVASPTRSRHPAAFNSNRDIAAFCPFNVRSHTDNTARMDPKLPIRSIDYTVIFARKMRDVGGVEVD